MGVDVGSQEPVNPHHHHVDNISRVLHSSLGHGDTPCILTWQPRPRCAHKPSRCPQGGNSGEINPITFHEVDCRAGWPARTRKWGSPEEE